MNGYQKVAFGFFALLVIFWGWIHLQNLTDGFYNYLYSFFFGLTPLIGGMVAMYQSRIWGGLRSAVGKAIFFIGLGGVLVRRNAVVILMCVELMLNAANLAFVAFSRRLGVLDERGSVFVVFVFVVAAAEVAVGLAIVLALYRNRPTVDVDEVTEIKG